MKSVTVITLQTNEKPYVEQETLMVYAFIDIIFFYISGFSKQAHVPFGIFNESSETSMFDFVPFKSISPEVKYSPFFSIFLSKLLSTIGVKPGVCEVRMTKAKVLTENTLYIV